MPSQSHSIISILQALRQIPPIGSHHRHPPSGSSANNFRQRHQSAPSVGTLHRHPPSAAFVSTLCRCPQSAPSVGPLRRHSGHANYHAQFALPGGPPEFFQRFFAGGVIFLRGGEFHFWRGGEVFSERFLAGGCNFCFSELGRRNRPLCVKTQSIEQRSFSEIFGGGTFFSLSFRFSAKNRFSEIFRGGCEFCFCRGGEFCFWRGGEFFSENFLAGGAISVFQSWGAGVVHHVSKLDQLRI